MPVVNQFAARHPGHTQYAVLAHTPRPNTPPPFHLWNTGVLPSLLGSSWHTVTPGRWRGRPN